MKYPPLETPVIVTMDDGVEFRAMRVAVYGNTSNCFAWSVADEHEPKCPECWDDGICWLGSRSPVDWRHIGERDAD